ncbi:uncharacterized protein LOC100186529 [Ciona intestinalis]
MMNLTFNVDKCSSTKHWEFLVLLPFGFLSIAFNLTLVVAATFNRRRLQRQSYVYACVTSTLLGNLLYVILHTWIILDNYLTKIEESGDEYTVTWTILQVSVASMLFVMCGNIGSLLFVVLDSTYFVGRSVNRKASEFAKGFISDIESVRSRRWLLSAKRRRAVILIALSWLLPVCLVISAATTWNCSNQCVYCRGGSPLVPPCANHTHCSTVWPPLTESYIGVNFVLWILEVFILGYLIVCGIRSFQQVMAPPTRTSSVMPVVKEENSVAESDIVAQEEYTLSDVHNAMTSLGDSDEEKKKEEENKIDEKEKKNDVKKSMKRNHHENGVREVGMAVNDVDTRIMRSRPSFRSHSRLTFMIVISLTFVVCSFPTFVVFLVDTFANISSRKVARLTTMVMMYIYTFICPFLLLKYLPNLKSALILMFSNCSVTRIPKRRSKRETTTR